MEKVQRLSVWSWKVGAWEGGQDQSGRERFPPLTSDLWLILVTPGCDGHAHSGGALGVLAAFSDTCSYFCQLCLTLIFSPATPEQVNELEEKTPPCHGARTPDTTAVKHILNSSFLFLFLFSQVWENFTQ